MGGLACRITTFLAMDGAVRKGERREEKRKLADIVVRRQEVFVLSESGDVSYQSDDSLVAI